MDFYILDNAEMPWGDYGSILLSGMTSHLSRKKGLLQLERTGPFVPAITCSGVSDLIVTDEFKSKLQESGLTGFSFMPVVKKHIVELDWTTWDKSKDDPLVIPTSGEPEDYILPKKHNPKVAEEMGAMWEMKIEEGAKTEKRKAQVPKRWSQYDIYLLSDSWNGSDFFTAEGVGYIYVSEKAKLLLERNAGEWLKFEKALVI